MNKNQVGGYRVVTHDGKDVAVSDSLGHFSRGDINLMLKVAAVSLQMYTDCKIATSLVLPVYARRREETPVVVVLPESIVTEEGVRVLLVTRGDLKAMGYADEALKTADEMIDGHDTNAMRAEVSAGKEPNDWIAN